MIVPKEAIPKVRRLRGGVRRPGLRVTERAELVPALRRALRAVQDERRHALVDVECA
jgi:hypothetical protein